MDKLIERAFFALMAGLLSFAVSALQTISHSITELNEKVAVLIEQSNTHRAEIDRLSNRVSELERKKRI